ncbi:acyl-CoA thioesterase [Garicola koreensis]|uniref:Acyl-CoA thioester hydrolase n=1 Tax=Garicola koreensis TaxID=1262554 RepID=A0A7W5Y185_9MICC|nr:thioesterase family protein [Garicola koreensis]MBB3667943.1 acyl-CoA thioester hydrolase [Garicola koreensis]
MNYSADAPQYAFRCELQLRWSDQDLLGHVNNARTVTLAEEARVRADTAWFDDAAKVGSRVVRTQRIDFEAPIRYGPSLYASVWVARIGRTSFTLVHDLWQQGHRCALIEAVMVEVDPETGRPVPISDEDRELLEAHAADSSGD